jgi:hypothetical protein
MDGLIGHGLSSFEGPFFLGPERSPTSLMAIDGPVRISCLRGVLAFHIVASRHAHGVEQSWWCPVGVLAFHTVASRTAQGVDRRATKLVLSCRRAAYR